VNIFTEVEDELIVYCSFKKFRNYWQYTHRPVVTFINALDQHKFAAAILMDLSKAFDCLPHDLYFKN
jgi:hypothetical protein